MAVTRDGRLFSATLGVNNPTLTDDFVPRSGASGVTLAVWCRFDFDLRFLHVRPDGTTAELAAFAQAVGATDPAVRQIALAAPPGGGLRLILTNLASEPNPVWIDAYSLGVPFEHPHAAGVADHATDASSRLAAQFQESARLQALVRILGARAAALEQAAADVRAFRSIDTALGAQLDIVGAQLDLPRFDLGDEDYRARLKARAIAISARGTPEELLSMLRLLVDDPDKIVLEEHAINTSVLRCDTRFQRWVDGQRFADILRGAIPAGTRLILEHSDRASGYFGFDDDASALGFAEDNAPTVGGTWLEAS